MMKRLKTILALVLAMTASLAACGGSDTTEEPADDTAGQTTEEPADNTGSESDLAYVQDKGTLVVGITYFAPLDYKEEGSDEWIGFDADIAKAFAESLGVNVEFQEITWDYKVEELNSRAIDCVWNGMTLSEDVLAAMGTSTPYCTNYQTLVYPADKAADFEGLTSLEGLNIAVESGSAGEDADHQRARARAGTGQRPDGGFRRHVRCRRHRRSDGCRDDRRGHQLRRSCIQPQPQRYPGPALRGVRRRLPAGV